MDGWSLVIFTLYAIGLLGLPLYIYFQKRGQIISERKVQMQEYLDNPQQQSKLVKTILVFPTKLLLFVVPPCLVLLSVAAYSFQEFSVEILTLAGSLALVFLLAVYRSGL